MSEPTPEQWGRLWHEDAPEGQAYHCPDCDSVAVLGGNAAYHASRKHHGFPILRPWTPPIDPNSVEGLRAEVATLRAELQRVEGELATAQAQLADLPTLRGLADQASEIAFHLPVRGRLVDRLYVLKREHAEALAAAERERDRERERAERLATVVYAAALDLSCELVTPAMVKAHGVLTDAWNALPLETQARARAALRGDERTTANATTTTTPNEGGDDNG